MSELAKCRLCGSEAFVENWGECICGNEKCTLHYVDMSYEEWNLLNAPDPRVAELEALCGEVAEYFICSIVMIRDDSEIVGWPHIGESIGMRSYFDCMCDDGTDLDMFICNLKAASEGKDNA